MIEQQQTIIQIVPRLPPAIDGVGDYAFNLARQLRKDFNIQTHFIVGNPTWIGKLELDGFPTSHITDGSSHSLIKLLNDRSCPVILHYVGYGYAKRGCPVWLVEALETWKQDHENFHLVTMFHEICASGPIWTSSFWLSGLQQNLAKRLTSLSDRILTSREQYGEILENLSEGKHSKILSLPVFSNIGEPDFNSIPPLGNRLPQLVIFGGQQKRLKAFRDSFRQISLACKILKISKILDIGPHVGGIPIFIGDIPVKQMGILPAVKIQQILLDSLAGYFVLRPDYLAKSTIFAAYASHGMLPVAAYTYPLVVDGLQWNLNYWYPLSNTSEPHLDCLQAISNKAIEWYQEHSIKVQSNIYLDCLSVKSS